jgi:hypothetical protein
MRYRFFVDIFLLKFMLVYRFFLYIVRHNVIYDNVQRKYTYIYK